MSLYLAVFMVALSAALLVTPLARRTALRLDIIDRPGGRKAHHTPVPYLGGLAIYVGFMLFLVAVVALNRTDPRTPLVQALAILAGATLMVVLGLVDMRDGRHG